MNMAIANTRYRASRTTPIDLCRKNACTCTQVLLRRRLSGIVLILRSYISQHTIVFLVCVFSASLVVTISHAIGIHIGFVYTILYLACVFVGRKYHGNLGMRCSLNDNFPFLTCLSIRSRACARALSFANNCVYERHIQMCL